MVVIKDLVIRKNNKIIIKSYYLKIINYFCN